MWLKVNFTIASSRFSECGDREDHEACAVRENSNVFGRVFPLVTYQYSFKGTDGDDGFG